MKSFVRVVTPPSIEPITVQQAKDWLKETEVDASIDAQVAALIKVVRRYAENYTGRAFNTQVLELDMDCWGENAYEIELPRPPLQGVTSVKYSDINGVFQTVDASLYQVDTYREPGRIKPTWGQYWPVLLRYYDFNAVQIRYTAGYNASPDTDAVPEGIRQWMLTKIVQLYEFREAFIDVRGTPAEVPRAHVDGLLDAYRVNLFK